MTIPKCIPRSAEENDGQPKVERLFMKKKGIGSDAKAERMATADADLQLLSGAERERQLLKQKKRRRHGHEDEVCYRLFFDKLAMLLIL